LDILVLKRKGLSEREIARKTGISRTTVRRYLKNPELASQERQTPHKDSILDPYEQYIKAWLEEDIAYKATWIYDRLCKVGYVGSYEVVKRKVGEIKEQKQQIAYMRFETEPGYQAQVDFGEFQVEQSNGTVNKLYLFSMILGYSRKIYAQLIEKCDMTTFLNCHIRAFEYFNGVPEEILYDRMKNVYLGRLAGKNNFNTSLVSLGLHYCFKPQVAPAYAAWVKGKIERPYRFIREGFWRGYSFVCLQSANRDLSQWIDKKDQRVHGTTHEIVTVRFEREKPHLSPLPAKPFDVSYRVYRKVHKDCLVHFEANSYVVPHIYVGKEVILRVKDDTMRIFADDQLIVTYPVAQGKGQLVQDKRFYEDLLQDHQMNQRKYAHTRQSKGRAKQTISPVKPPYDMDVEIRSLDVYQEALEEVKQ